MSRIWLTRFRVGFRKYHRTVWVLVAGRLLTTAVLFMALPFVTMYLKSRGIPLATIGLVLAAGPLGSALGSLVGGQLADRLGRRPLIIVGLAAGGAATAALAMAAQTWVFALLYAAQGFCGALSGPAWSAALTDIVPEGQRREAFSLDRVAINVGCAIGPLAGALVTHRALVFVAVGLSNIAFAALCAVMVPEPLPAAARRCDSCEGQGHATPTLRQDLSDWRRLLTDRVMSLYLIARVLSILAYTQVYTTYSLYVGQFSAHPERLFSAVISLNGALVVAAQLWLTRRTERWSVGKQMVTGSLLYALSYLVFAAPGSDALPLLACAIFTVGEMVIAPSQLSFVARLAPAHARARYMGATLLAGTVGSLFAGSVGTWLFGRFGGAGLMLVMAAVAAASAALFAVSARRVERQVAAEQLLGAERAADPGRVIAGDPAAIGWVAEQSY